MAGPVWGLWGLVWLALLLLSDPAENRAGAAGALCQCRLFCASPIVHTRRPSKPSPPPRKTRFASRLNRRGRGRGRGAKQLTSSRGLAAAMKRFTLLLQVLGAGAVSDTVCDPAGLQLSPPVCQRASESGTAHMPTVFGGPATLGQCVYGHFHDQQSNYGGGASCWTGALFAFSGIVTPSPKSPRSPPPSPPPHVRPLNGGPLRVGAGRHDQRRVGIRWLVRQRLVLSLPLGPLAPPAPRLRTGRAGRSGAGHSAGGDERRAAGEEGRERADRCDVEGLADDRWVCRGRRRRADGGDHGPRRCPPPPAFPLAPLPPTHLTRSSVLAFSAGSGSKPGSCAVSDGCCNAVKQFPFGGATPAAASTAAAFQHWRWVIEKSHDGSVSHNRDLFPPRFGLRFSPHLINSDGFTGRALPSATLALRSQAPGGPTRAGRWPRRATATRAAARRAAC